MDIKLMCLGNEVSPAMATAQKAIENDFKAVFDGEFKFTNYGSEKEFIQALSGAIETEDVLVLACQPELYTAFKSFVANAFTFKARPVKAIQRLIQESAPTVSSETVLNHSLIPVDADAILSQDGLYSGYAVNADDQILIVLPLDPSRIDFILEDGLFPYLRDMLDIGEFVDDPLKGIVGEADGVAVGAAAAARAEEAAAEEKPAEAPVKKGPYDAEYLDEVICKLREKGLTVAVATTKTVDFLKSISETVNMDQVIFLSPYTFAKNDMKADEDQRRRHEELLHVREHFGRQDRQPGEDPRETRRHTASAHLQIHRSPVPHDGPLVRHRLRRAAVHHGGRRR